MIGAAALLLLGALAAPSLGLIGIAQAKKTDEHSNINPRDDPRGDSPLLDLDIKDYGFEAKNAFIEVYGEAGGTVGAHDEAIAYVLEIITKEGEAQTWAIDSHEKQHGNSGTGEEWHAHRIHLTDNPNVPGPDISCLNEVDHVTHAMMDGSRVMFEDMKVKSKNGIEGISAKTVTSASTVRLQVLVDDPDNPPVGTACIAQVLQVFDSADLDEKKDS